MSDLVERLRNMELPDNPASTSWTSQANRLMTKSADLIEQQQARIEALKRDWRETLIEKYEFEPLGGTVKRNFDTAEEYADAVLAAQPEEP